MNSKTFVTDGHWRKSLAAVRALGSKGIGVTVGESTRLNTAAFSRYCNRAVVYPSPFFMQSEFVDFVLSELTRNSYEMLLVMEDQTLELLTPYHADISKYTCFPSVNHEKLRFAQSKDKVLKLAEEKGIPVPKTWYIEDLSQLEDIKDTLPYPVVIKPRKSSGAVGIAYPQTPDDLKERYIAVHRRFPYPMIQERIPREGAGYGASFLLDEQSRIKASFVHKRLREYPITGGASTLRESVRYDDIRDMAVTLLKSLGWFGVAMVEFKLDPRDNTPKLMEINPRFWGSLALAIESGVNFPYLLYRMARGENIKPVEQYQIGKRCRWLLPGDILNFIHNPERMGLVPGFFDFWDKNTAYDILSVRDPLPVIGRLLTPLTFLYDRDMKYRLKQKMNPTSPKGFRLRHTMA
jgi:predicted ATP-grasp superfamily ATP-dependent carboligase